MTQRELRVVVTCEHGGKRIPVAYRRLFRRQQTLLDSHRGYDPGALDLARALARRLRAPLRYSRVSRLLVDLNRSPGHRRLFSEQTRELPEPEKTRLLAIYYHPHRLSIERTIAAYLANGSRVLHVASHSFTPVLGEEERDADVAWLYDPSRQWEKEMSRLWRRSLACRRPDLRLRFNYPYRGVADGLVTHLRSRFPTGYAGLELEVNQSWHSGDSDERARLQRDIVDSIAGILRSAGLSP